MAVNARTEEFQHIEVFDKPALFTNGRIARDTVPEGWYCYDIRGSDDDPGALCYMEENVVVNHAGSVLMPEKLVMPIAGQIRQKRNVQHCLLCVSLLPCRNLANERYRCRSPPFLKFSKKSETEATRCRIPIHIIRTMKKCIRA